MTDNVAKVSHFLRGQDRPWIFLIRKDREDFRQLLFIRTEQVMRLIKKQRNLDENYGNIKGNSKCSIVTVSHDADLFW